jgi:N-acetylgalactosamine-N,N'-diacetylbacillosaminyl-diphospho-undecaprenol 4-alpha-N-acetylgalactosaminyltransferase
MKKLTIFIYSLASGGAERQVSILINELKGKYKIKLVLMRNVIFYDIPENVEVVLLEDSNPYENGIKKLIKLPFLAYKFAKIKDEIVISFMNRPNYINVMSNFLKKSKTIISERIAPSQEYKTNSLKDKISRFLIKFLYNRADLIVPNSKWTAYELSSLFKVPNNKIKVIYNNVLEVECKKNISDNFIFIHIGRFDYQKNHKLLINSFKEANLEAELWLIGDGPLREELENLVKELKSEEKVRFLGRQKDVFKFLSQADCFVFSSNYEGFPNVLLEALSCELPVISTDCRSGPREILAPDTDIITQTQDIEIAEYGILTPVGDEEKLAKAMKLMYEDEKLRYNFKQKAKERIKEFEVSKIIKEWEKII